MTRQLPLPVLPDKRHVFVCLCLSNIFPEQRNAKWKAVFCFTYRSRRLPSLPASWHWHQSASCRVEPPRWRCSAERETGALVKWLEQHTRGKYLSNRGESRMCVEFLQSRLFVVGEWEPATESNGAACVAEDMGKMVE